MTERILIVHNSYQHRGGEDSVVESEITLLRSHGHVVETYFRTNNDVTDISSLLLARQTLWSTNTTHDLAKLIGSFRPDVIHAHNTVPLISPSLYWVAERSRVPVVQTLHNFRLFCLNAFFLRDGKVCEDCLGHLPWRGVAHACYRGSRAASATLAGMLTLHRGLGTYRNQITRYIALNEFCRNKFIEGGLPAERIAVKPNFVELSKPAPGKRSGFLFVGRLSTEKGMAVLARAACGLTDVQVRVVGAGSEKADLADVPGIEWLGTASGAQVREEMERALALVFPSICYETFGLVVLEAFASGTPVIGSRIGAIPNLVEEGVTGLLFTPGDAADLANKMRWAGLNPERMAAMGHAARACYEAKYTPAHNYDQLVAIYRDAIDDVKKAAHESAS